jgi:hypothetical protein
MAEDTLAETQTIAGDAICLVLETCNAASKSTDNGYTRNG